MVSWDSHLLLVQRSTFLQDFSKCNIIYWSLWLTYITIYVFYAVLSSYLDLLFYQFKWIVSGNIHKTVFCEYRITAKNNAVMSEPPSLQWFRLSFWLLGSYRRNINSVFMMTSSNGIICRVTGPLCGSSPVTGEFPAQKPVTRSFEIFFDLRLNKRLSKGWWFETPSRSLWRHRSARLLARIVAGFKDKTFVVTSRKSSSFFSFSAVAVIQDDYFILIPHRLQPTSSIITDAKLVDSNLDDFAW